MSNPTVTSIPHEINIDQIEVGDRQRIDHSDTDGIKDSISRFGLIEPIIVSPLSGGRYQLIAGGRRLTFLKELSLTTLYHGSTYTPGRPGFLFGSELDKDAQAELELEENIRRKQMTWQEHVRGIAKIHFLKTAKALDGERRWTQKLTGELFNVSVASVNNALALAAELRNPESPAWRLTTANDGLRYLFAKEQQELEAELVRRQAEQSKNLVTGEASDLSFLDGLTEPSPANSSTADAEKEAARDIYLLNPHNDPDAFDAYWAEKQAQRAQPVKMYLSKRIINSDCLPFMAERKGVFNHIITDPPYGIDMDNLDQQNQGMANIDSVAHTHVVADNLKLLRDFIPLAYESLRDRGFLVMWADYDHWNTLSDVAQRAGFRVQRWPVVWVKTHQCKNSMANHNFTKTTEIAIICSKGGATLAKTAPLGHIIAPHDEYKDMMDHPFVKPFAAWQHVIEAVSLENELVYEPFSGEGSGTLSLLRLNRNVMATEKDPVHYNKQMLHVRDYYTKLNPNTQFI
jgi:DNA modification methylase